MDHGYAETLVISSPENDKTSRPAACNEKRKYLVLCFSPDPVTTRGEAQALKALSEQYEWKSVNVLTAPFHVTRARVIFGRCYSGDLSMTAFNQPLPIFSLPKLEGSWTYHFAYESAAFLKVALTADC